LRSSATIAKVSQAYLYWKRSIAIDTAMVAIKDASITIR
jgi:hypothetical protein